MNNLADIKRRIASVKQTRQITGAMETISVSKMRKSFEMSESNGAYSALISKTAAEIFLSCGDELAEMSPPADGAELFIIIASDKGLCGGFNHDIFKFADKILDERAAVIPIGRTAYEKYGDRKDVNIEFATSATPDYNMAKAISKAVLGRYGKDVKSVAAIYGEVQKGGAVKPTKKQILPIEKKADLRPRELSLEPSATELYREILPLYLTGTIYTAIVSGAAAEHGARRAAMAASSKSADETIYALSTEYNRARQSSVTAQITEIIGSTQAFGDRGDTK